MKMLVLSAQFYQKKIIQNFVPNNLLPLIQFLSIPPDKTLEMEVRNAQILQ